VSTARGSGVVAIAPGWLGDAVVAIPALRAAESLGALTILAHPRVAPLLEIAFSGRVVPYAGRAASIAALRQARSLTARPPAIALALPRSFSAALRAFVTGAPLRVGIASEGRGPLLTRCVRLPWPERTRHLAEEYVLLAAAAGAPAPAAAPSLDVPRDAVQAAWRLLDAHGVAAETPLVIVGAGAAFGSAKRWFSSRYGELCAAIDAAGARAVLIGTASERPVTARVANAAAGRGARPPVDLAGETDVRALCGLIAAARCVVANDSGPMHLAAAIGTPVVALFGSTNPEWTRPLGDGHEIVRYPAPCAPCYRRECPIGRFCFDGIDVERVRRAVAARLA